MLRDAPRLLAKTIYNRFICWARERIQYRGGGRLRRGDLGGLIAFGLRRFSRQVAPGKF
ncbi:hypothetical protein [Allosphingosinicella humi]